MTSFAPRLLVLLALGCVLVPVGHAEEEPTLVVSKWLGLPSVDRRGRAPFNPSAVFERYLWKGDATPPVAGETIRGTGGREAKWRLLEPDEKGRIPGRGLSIAYGTVKAPAAAVWLAEVVSAGTLYVNGVPYGGDVYGHGITKVPVPFEKGPNHVYAAGFRGDWRIAFQPAPAPVFIASWDATLPDLVLGDGVTRKCGFLIVNATEAPVTGLRLGARTSSGIGFEELPPLPPLGQLKARLSVAGLTASDARVTCVLDRIADAGGMEVLHEAEFDLAVRKHPEAHRRTFVSEIDGSVQYYGVRRPDGEKPEGAETGLVLTLHGAGVGARGQANAYHPKPDFWIVAPTNRRKFGFDWQDWGRTDAYEVLQDALKVSRVDRRHVHVTGHSMGGHGTWHLAANDPDGFASAAPSAGWASFDSYGGRPSGPLTRLWHAADAASQTEKLIPNFRDLPVYVLHGTKDDNVPVREAEAMERMLKDTARHLQVDYIEGKGHWWNGDAPGGTDCVDWPPFFEMFRKHRIPEAPTDIDVTFADLSLDADHFWVRVVQPLFYGSLCRVRARWNAPKRELVLETENVRQLRLTPPEAWTVETLRLDDTNLPFVRQRVHQRSDAVWVEKEDLTDAQQKRPEAMGPFKRAFDHRFLIVYGTHGTEEENAATLAAARLAAEQWRYRANGRAECCTDDGFLALHRKVHQFRNVILFGNATTNAAWDALVPKRCPIRPERGKLTAGVKTFEGDHFGLLLVYPRKGTLEQQVAVVAGTGVPGTRLGSRIPYFLSGVGIPDYVIFGPEVLKYGDQGVRAAGLFDVNWSLAD